MQCSDLPDAVQQGVRQGSREVSVHCCKRPSRSVERRTKGASYGVIRHPSYLGLLVNALGWALAFRSGVGVLFVALIIPRSSHASMQKRGCCARIVATSTMLIAPVHRG
jgi:hypothetical protein